MRLYVNRYMENKNSKLIGTATKQPDIENAQYLRKVPQSIYNLSDLL